MSQIPEGGMLLDPDELAAWVYRRAGCSPSTPPGPAWLLLRIVGDDRVDFRDGAPVHVVRDGDRYRVTVPREHSRERVCITLSCALALLAYRATGQVEEPSDSHVMKTALAVLMPREALLTFADTLGVSAAKVAAVFGVPEEMAQRRIELAGWLESSGLRGPGRFKVALH